MRRSNKQIKNKKDGAVETAKKKCDCSFPRCLTLDIMNKFAYLNYMMVISPF